MAPVEQTRHHAGRFNGPKHRGPTRACLHCSRVQSSPARDHGVGKGPEGTPNGQSVHTHRARRVCSVGTVGLRSNQELLDRHDESLENSSGFGVSSPRQYESNGHCRELSSTVSFTVVGSLGEWIELIPGPWPLGSLLPDAVDLGTRQALGPPQSRPGKGYDTPSLSTTGCAGLDNRRFLLPTPTAVAADMTRARM